MAGFTTPEIWVKFKSKFLVAATTTDQVAMSIDLSSYAGTGNHNGGLRLRFWIHAITLSASLDPTGEYIVVLTRNGIGNWSIKGTPGSGAVDFAMSTNTLQCRIDGSTTECPVVIWVEGSFGDYNTV